MPERFKVVCIPCKALYKCSALLLLYQKTMRLRPRQRLFSCICMQKWNKSLCFIIYLKTKRRIGLIDDDDDFFAIVKPEKITAHRTVSSHYSVCYAWGTHNKSTRICLRNSNACKIRNKKLSYRRDSARRRSLRRSMSFKVTDFGINRKSVCHFLKVNNTTLHPISSVSKLL